MNDYTNPVSAIDQSAVGTAKPLLGNIYPSIFLPRKIYEALPTGYILVGTLFILGAAYIGIGHGLMGGYLFVGLSCILAGVSVNSIRRRERSKTENAMA